MAEYKTMVTDIGIKKIADATLNGAKVDITEAAVGDGGGQAYVPTTAQKKLKRETWRGPIVYKQINEQDENIIDIKIMLPSDVGGFTVREAGLFDDSGDMIVVCNIPPTEKVIAKSGVANSLTLYMHVIFSDMETVEIKVEPTLDVMTRDEVEEALSNFANSIITENMVIPHTGWINSTDPTHSGEYQRDVPMEQALLKHFPCVHILEPSREIARAAGLSSENDAVDHAIRFWAKRVPSEDMTANVALLFPQRDGSASGGGGEGGGGTPGEYVLPVATDTRLGGVKVGGGRGINITPDGTLSTPAMLNENIATDEDAKSLINEIFGE